MRSVANAPASMLAQPSAPAWAGVQELCAGETSAVKKTEERPMKRLNLRMLPLLALVVTFAPVVCHAQEEAATPSKAAAKAPAGVDITSRLTATAVGGGPVQPTLVARAAHTPTRPS